MEEFPEEEPLPEGPECCRWCGVERPERQPGWKELEFGLRCPTCCKKEKAREEKEEEEGVESGALLSARVKLEEGESVMGES